MEHCEYCEGPVDPGRPGSFQWTAGWVEARAEGGGHGITRPERFARWACKTCIMQLRAGINPRQSSLF